MKRLRLILAWCFEGSCEDSMAGVLEGACVVGVCKLACSLLFLPTYSGTIAFCCCCLLLFTDFLVTGSLLFLWIAKPWLPELFPLSHVIALRFLLFLAHTYGAVLLLTTPLVVVETTMRELWPRANDTYQTVDTEVGKGSAARRHPEFSIALAKGVESPLDGDSERIRDKLRRLGHAIGYLSCLSAWMVSGLQVSCRGWELEELWVAVCLHTTDSLIDCLPRMFPSLMEPWWGLAFLCLMLLLLLAVDLCTRIGEVKPNDSGNIYNTHNSWQHLVPAPSQAVETGPSASVSEPELVPALTVDPEKRMSGYIVHGAEPRKSGTTSWARRGDPILLSTGTSSADLRQAEAREETKGGPVGAYFHVTERQGRLACRSEGGWRPQRGFPCLGVSVMTGLLAVVSVCSLPLNLSVNILLIQTVEAVAEVCVESSVSLLWKDDRETEERVQLVKT